MPAAPSRPAINGGQQGQATAGARATAVMTMRRNHGMPEIKLTDSAPLHGLPDSGATAEPAGVAVGMRRQAAARSLPGTRVGSASGPGGRGRSPGGGACGEHGRDAAAQRQHGGITVRVPGEAVAAGSRHHEITAPGRRGSCLCHRTGQTLITPIAHRSGPGGRQGVPAHTTVYGHVHS